MGESDSGAFGKSKEDLDKVTPYNQGSNFAAQKARQQAAAAGQKAARGTGGGGGSRFRDIFKPSTEMYDWVRLHAGEFKVPVGVNKKDPKTGEMGVVEELTLEYVPNTEHFFARNGKSCTCSGGPLSFIRTKREPCAGCDLFWSSMETDPVTGKKKKGAMSKRDLYAFSMTHLCAYHKTDSVDRSTGKARTRDDGTAYYDWVPCHGRRCAMCDDGKEKREANVMHWNMGVTHFELLTGEFSNKVSGTATTKGGCKSCGTKDGVTVDAFTCMKCGDPIIEMANTRLSDQELLNLVGYDANGDRRLVKCGHCGHEGALKEELVCAGCPSPVRASIFDIRFQVKRVGTGQNDATILVFGDYVIEPIPEAQKELYVPLDLLRIYGPTPIEVQEKVWGLKSDGSNPSAGSRPLSR